MNDNTNNLMIAWTYSPQAAIHLGRVLTVYSSSGKEKEIKGSKEQDFLATLDEYVQLGFEIINISTGNDNYVLAFLRKRTN